MGDGGAVLEVGESQILFDSPIRRHQLRLTERGSRSVLSATASACIPTNCEAYEGEAALPVFSHLAGSGLLRR